MRNKSTVKWLMPFVDISMSLTWFACLTPNIYVY